MSSCAKFIHSFIPLDKNLELLQDCISDSFVKALSLIFYGNKLLCKNYASTVCVKISNALLDWS